MELKGKTVIVTGSSRGIGLAIALAFAEQGANIVLNATKAIPQEVLDRFASFEGSVTSFIGDIADYTVAEQFIKTVVEEFGSFEILVNNAGITKDGLLMRMSEKDYDDVLNVNLKGTFNMIRFATPIFVKQKSGSIINLTSVVGLTGNAGQVNYAASKAGIIGLTKSVAKEIGSRGITVNAVAPGYIDTDMTKQLSDKIRQEWVKQIPLRRFGHVEEVADTCVFLAKSPYITGQVIQVNGGLYM